MRRFPDGFTWGVAAAAYQIEGAVDVDGRGPSIWDTFSHTPGKVAGGDNGDVACDHYHRWSADLDLMVDLGVTSYRFSVSWSRVLPDGRTVNPAGVAFYDRLVDGLVARGIRPLMTLYHWDLPEALDDGGRAGWLARDTADRFAEFAALMGKQVGDRVPAVITLNEPWCSAYLGYGSGEHAPGLTSNPLALRAAHHLNLAHGRAVSALRSVLPATAQVAVTLNLQEVHAASDSPADLAAAAHADLVANRVFLDPMLNGSYPDQLRAQTAHLTDWSFVHDGDEAAICQPLDFLGINYYNPARVADPAAAIAPFPGTDRAGYAEPPEPHTAMGWPIQPAGLTDLLVRTHREFGLPLVVTENGAAFADHPEPSGAVVDTDRISYLRAHLHALLDAIDAGADVRGYHLWTLLDNFEWAWGYDMRFGVVRVDLETQVRTPKASARWYADVVRANAVP
jgi:beta-glucosidase